MYYFSLFQTSLPPSFNTFLHRLRVVLVRNNNIYYHHHSSATTRDFLYLIKIEIKLRFSSFSSAHNFFPLWKTTIRKVYSAKGGFFSFLLYNDFFAIFSCCHYPILCTVVRKKKQMKVNATIAVNKAQQWPKEVGLHIFI